MESYRGEFEHPKFPKDSEAVTSESAQPVAVSVPNINYTPHDDKMIDNFHRLKRELVFVVLLSLMLTLVA